VQVLTMKQLLETGVHFGHRTRKWNPKMGPYIFTERKGIHIVDLEQTVDLFEQAYFFVRDQVASGKEILFVGTKKQVHATIEEEAMRCGAHYVSQRWLGGTLTNFTTIRRSIDRMLTLETMVEEGKLELIPPKEATQFRRELAKLKRNLDGLRRMKRIPDMLYVIDPDVEANAVHEAQILDIPVIAIVDTNCDPDPIDYLIPGNDDAIKATKLITSRIADAAIEGLEGKQGEAEEEPEQEDEEQPEPEEAIKQGSDDSEAEEDGEPKSPVADDESDVEDTVDEDDELDAEQDEEEPVEEERS